MRLEPRDSLFEAGNEIFPEHTHKTIESFNRCVTEQNELLYLEYRLDTTDVSYRVYLDAGLPFWSETALTDYEKDPDVEYELVTALVGRRIQSIHWFPDSRNSKILFDTDGHSAVLQCKNPDLFDSAAEFKLIQQ
ncbi:hypothetical protein NAT51_05425 [Flavobacterium amniphilum]|uniref:hypothetical protein n=1 Tax=Flavobacterium amniphilum TaxID=1834035 RepID=UPI00202A1C13|nr:hypothetical protein [Flavobacterium amniphilum]MCL9804947.1 hypothetical protein [Flavobacterium amniphilum]